MPKKHHLFIYYSAAFVNTIGVFVLSQGLTSQALMDTDPTLFSRFGLVMIMMWGVCYYACAQAAYTHRSISVSFALEKLIYVCMWIMFILGPVDWSQLYERDLLAGLFYSIYGVIDAIYLTLFLYCAYHARPAEASDEATSS